MGKDAPHACIPHPQYLGRGGATRGEEGRGGVKRGDLGEESDAEKERAVFKPTSGLGTLILRRTYPEETYLMNY